VTTTPGAETEAFYRELERNHLVALWNVTANLLPKEPRGRAIPYLWRWDTLLPLVRRAGELAPLSRGAERRVLGFINPGLPTRYGASSTCSRARSRRPTGILRPRSGSSSRATGRSRRWTATSA
jgi:gentisate 1,2-dioxygenase